MIVFWRWSLNVFVFVIVFVFVFVIVIFWSGHVSSSLWSNVSKVTSVWGHSVVIWRLWLLVVPDQARDRQTRCPIELFWTAKNDICNSVLSSLVSNLGRCSLESQQNSKSKIPLKITNICEWRHCKLFRLFFLRRTTGEWCEGIMWQSSNLSTGLERASEAVW